MFFSKNNSSSYRSSSRRSRTRSRVFVSLRLLVNLIVLFFFFGKPLMLPVGIALSPVSNSQVNRLDLMIIAPSYMGELKTGDLVLACRSGWWNTACVTGILNGDSNGSGRNGNGNGFALVSVLGDGNGLRGTFIVNGDIRLFKVVGRIPREIWIPAFAVYLCYLIIEIRRVFKRDQILGENASIVALTTVLIVINSFIVGSTYIDQATVTFALPEVRVSDTFFLHNSSLLVRLVTRGDYVLLNAECNLTPSGINGVPSGVNGFISNSERSSNKDGNRSHGNGRNLIPLNTAILDQRSILVEIPLEIYMLMFNRTEIEELPVMPATVVREAQLPVACRVTFDKFEYLFVVYARFYWRDLEARIEHLRYLAIDNPNPVNISVTITIFDIDRDRIVLRERVEIHRLSTLEYDLWELGIERARIILEYELLGLRRIRIGYYDKKL